MRFFTLYSGSGGNATYIESGETAILIDAGKNAKKLRSALTEIGSSIDKIDAIFITHDHADHYDPESVRSIIAVYPECKCLGPTSTLNHFIKDGYNKSNFTKLDVGESTKFDDVEIIAVPAYHSDKLAVGYIFKIAGKNVYISGDTIYDPTLSADIKKACANIDIMCICINGKLGNMPWEESVKVVSEVKPKFVYPMHYGLFARNTEDTRPFLREVKAMGIETEEPSVNGRIFNS